MASTRRLLAYAPPALRIFFVAVAAAYPSFAPSPPVALRLLHLLAVQFAPEALLFLAQRGIALYERAARREDEAARDKAVQRAKDASALAIMGLFICVLIFGTAGFGLQGWAASCAGWVAEAALAILLEEQQPREPVRAL